ncbi:MAG TPA: recombinase family protein [Blastocatellia bacterium]|nr:recombinase family protein [Blastocatellia bacterium]
MSFLLRTYRAKESGIKDIQATAYVRLSQDGPDRPAQEQAIGEAAAKAGLEIADTFVEVAEIAEGDIVDRRMALFELLGAAHSGKVKTVVVAGWNVISNTPTEATLIELTLEKAGARVIFADGFDSEPYRDSARNLVRAKD